MEEVWKEIPGYKYYQASNWGRIKSMARTQIKRNRWNRDMNFKIRERILKPYQRKNGYFYVAIGKQEFFEVHRLVAMAFHGLPSPGLVVNHIDGNTLNNRPENLEWLTQRQNRLHSQRVLKKKAVRLSVQDVLEIIRLKSTGMTGRSIGKRFGVTEQAISLALNGITFNKEEFPEIEEAREKYLPNWRLD